MARALKIKYAGSVVTGIQDIADAEIDAYAARLAASWLAAQVSVGITPVGSLNVNGALGKSVGTFIDTRRVNAIGTHPVGTTVTSTTFDFKQVEPPDQVTLTGTVAVTAGGTSLTGTATLFTTELEPGDFIRVSNSANTVYDFALVRTVTNDTTATLDTVANIKTALSGATCNRSLRSSALVIKNPVGYSPTLKGLQEASALDIVDTIISRAASILVVSGPSSYTLQTAAPGTGTWVSRATVTNTRVDGVNNSTYLWQRTDTGATTVTRPLYRNGSNLKEMTDAEMQQLGQLLSIYLMASGKGRYAVSNLAPTSPGTWVQVGAAFDDTRYTLLDTSYTGTFATAFTGAYAGAFTGSYSRAYTGAYASTFTGAYAGAFTGSYTGSYNSSFARAFAGSYTGSYNQTFSRAFVASWARVFARAFVQTYAGVNFATYTGNYTGYFNGLTYTGNFTRAFAGAYAGTYTGSFTRAFAGAYAGTYTGSFSGTYTGSFSGTYNQAYAGTYTGSFSGAYNNSFSRGFAGLTVTNTLETPSSIKLWIRTA